MRHPDKDVNKLLKKATATGWVVEKAAGHPWGRLKCGHGCTHYILSTPRGPAGSQAKILREKIAKCVHLS